MRLFLILAFLFLPIELYAQEWEESKESYESSIVQLEYSRGTSISRGTGSVVKFIKDSERFPDYYIGIVLTASHVVPDEDSLATITFSTGKKTQKNSVIVKFPYEKDMNGDLALIKALIPDEVEPLGVTEVVPPMGSNVDLGGFGTGSYRGWTAKFAGRKLGDDGIIVLSWGIQGDSGGPIIYNGKIIGVICRGSGLSRYKDTSRIIIAPIHGSSVKRVINFIKLYSS